MDIGASLQKYAREASMWLATARKKLMKWSKPSKLFTGVDSWRHVYVSKAEKNKSAGFGVPCQKTNFLRTYLHTQWHSGFAFGSSHKNM